jgi:hypothetical protein
MDLLYMSDNLDLAHKIYTHFGEICMAYVIDRPTGHTSAAEYRRERSDLAPDNVALPTRPDDPA